MANNEFDPQKIEDFLNRIRQSQNSWKFGGFIVAGLILLIMAVSSFYKIEPEEVGVVQRFGRYVKTTNPGLHFKLPGGVATAPSSPTWGISKVTKVKTSFVYKEEFGFATARSGVRTQYARGGRTDESLMLTGDLNMADVQWSVQYRINDPQKFLFNVRDPVTTLKDASEAAMRLVVGDRSVDEVLTVGREEINIQTQFKLQEILESYQTGIKVVTVELQDVNPPEPVKESFDDVNKAKQEKETLINQALEAYNKVIPNAKGEAEKKITSAEGYATKRVNEAQGDAQRFLDVYRAYAGAPTVIKRRLYIETMSELLGGLDNVWIVDDKLDNVVPLLQMMNPGAVKGGQK